MFIPTYIYIYIGNVQFVKTWMEQTPRNNTTFHLCTEFQFQKSTDTRLYTNVTYMCIYIYREIRILFAYIYIYIFGSVKTSCLCKYICIYIYIYIYVYIHVYIFIDVNM